MGQLLGRLHAHSAIGGVPADALQSRATFARTPALPLSTRGRVPRSQFGRAIVSPIRRVGLFHVLTDEPARVRGILHGPNALLIPERTRSPVAPDARRGGQSICGGRGAGHAGWSSSRKDDRSGLAVAAAASKSTGSLKWRWGLDYPAVCRVEGRATVLGPIRRGSVTPPGPPPGRIRAERLLALHPWGTERLCASSVLSDSGPRGVCLYRELVFRNVQRTGCHRSIDPARHSSAFVRGKGRSRS